MKKTVLSIIIVTYNNQEYLNQLLTNLTFIPKNWQVIIVDNNSTNKRTKQILQNFNHQENFTIIFNLKNIGFGKAVNQAVKLAKGQYLLLLNPDIIINHKQIDSLLAFARKQKKLGAVSPALVLTNDQVQASVYPLPTIWGAVKEFIFGLRHCYSPYIPKNKKAVQVPASVAACLLLPRSVFKRVGGLNEKYFLYFEDLNFCRQLDKLKLPIWYLPQVKVKHKMGESGHQKTNKLLNKSAEIYFGKTKKQIIDLIIRLGHFIPAVFIALFLSYLKLRITINTSTFGADQEYLAWQAYHAWHNHHFFLTGLPASIGGFFIAPYYSYLNALVFKILNFQPFALFVTSFVSNFITLMAIYYLGYLIFNHRRLPTYILMLSFALSRFATGLWPIDWLTLASVSFLISFVFLFAKKYNYSLIWLALSFFIGLSAHPSYIAFIPIEGLLYFYLWTKTSWSSRFFSLLTGLAALLPLIVFDFKHHGHNLKGVLTVLKDQKNRFDYIKVNHWQYFWLTIKNNIFIKLNWSDTLGLLFLFLTILFLILLKRNHKKKFFFYLSLFIISLLIIFSLDFSLTKTVDYYLLSPTIILVITSWLIVLEFFILAPLAIRYSGFSLLCFILIFFNGRLLYRANPFSWYYQHQAVKFITQNFDLSKTKLAIITQPGREKGFYYLFEQAKKYSSPTKKIAAKWVNLVFVSDWFNPYIHRKEFGGYKIYWK